MTFNDLHTPWQKCWYSVEYLQSFLDENIIVQLAEAVNMFEILTLYCSLILLRLASRLNVWIWILYDAHLPTDSLSVVFKPPDSGQYYRQTVWKITHRIQLTVIFHLTGRDHSDGDSFRQGRLNVFMNLRCRIILLLTARLFHLALYNTVIILSVLLSCELSFPVLLWKYIPCPPLHWHLLTGFVRGA